MPAQDYRNFLTRRFEKLLTEKVGLAGITQISKAAWVRSGR
ncbi:hypothetical protein ACTGJ9_039305 [Bradyrhizobium sp. RDM12]